MDIEDKKIPDKINPKESKDQNSPKKPDLKIDIKENKEVSWDEIENYIIEIGEQAIGYKSVLQKASVRNEIMDEFISYSVIILPALITFFSSIAAALNPSGFNNIGLVIEIVSFIATVVGGINKVKNFNKKANAFSLSAANYTALESDVREVLKKPIKLRPDSSGFFAFIERKNQSLFKACPNVPRDIWKKYYIEAKKNGLSLPPEISDTIKLRKNYERNMLRQFTKIDKITSSKENSSLKSEEKIEENEKGKMEEIKRTQITSAFPQFDGVSGTYDTSPEMLKFQLERMKMF